MAVQIGARGQASFAEPLELLADCHRRIEHFLGVLMRVVEGSRDGGLDGGQREGLAGALLYFRDAAPRHTADEEESLFPRLRACGGEEVAGALGRVEALQADHVRAEGLHAAVEAAGARWLQEGELPAEERGKLRGMVEELVGLYRGHLKVEDSEIFPLAGRALTAGQLAEIGQEMKGRRVRGG